MSSLPPPPPGAYAVPPAPVSQTRAWVALVLALLPACGVTALVGVVLAVGVLRRSKDGRDHGRVPAITALVLGGLQLAAALLVVLVFLFGRAVTTSFETDSSDLSQVVLGLLPVLGS